MATPLPSRPIGSGAIQAPYSTPTTPDQWLAAADQAAAPSNMAAALPAVATAAGSALGGVFSGKGAEDAARLTSQAAEQVAQIQAGTAAQALAFQKQSAAQDLANANVAALGNYNQYKARETYMNALRTRIGAPPIAIPAFTPYQAVADQSVVPASSLSGGTTQDMRNPIDTQNVQSASELMAGPTVRMQAPNGQTSLVSPDQVAHYQSLGAHVVVS